jgi:hypothetical protein
MNTVKTLWKESERVILIEKIYLHLIIKTQTYCKGGGTKYMCMKLPQ